MSSPTIVIIDDSRDILEQMHRFLVRHDFRVLVYDNPEAFVNDCHEDNFYLNQVSAYLIDIGLPLINGLDIHRTLNDLGARAPIIYMSGTASPQDVNNAWRNGAYEFIFKPFPTEDLLEILNKAISNPKPRSTLDGSNGINPALSQELTPREKDILKEIASGATSAQSAQKLGISERTVKLHRKNLRKRLGVYKIPDIVRIYEAIKHLI